MNNKAKVVQSGRNHFEKTAKAGVNIIMCTENGTGVFETGMSVDNGLTAMCMVGSIISKMCDNTGLHYTKVLRDLKYLLKTVEKEGGFKEKGEEEND